MSSILVCGPSSWNTLVYVDSLPQPVSQMIYAQSDHQTFGGTSLGKALNLAHLGHQVQLATQYGSDPSGQRIADVLAFAGIEELNCVDHVAGQIFHDPRQVGQEPDLADNTSSTSAVTERHLNLMTRTGQRISIYLESPSPSQGSIDRFVADGMARADAVVMDLSGESRRLLPLAQQHGANIWTDLHDYDGTNEFHVPFARSASYVFMNNDGLPDPLPYMRSLISNGATMAVCTLGAQGALAVTKDGELRVPAVETVVVDTNGAGDAFMSGVLDATLKGAPPHVALEAGATNAASVLSTENLHPTVDKFFRTAR